MEYDIKFEMDDFEVVEENSNSQFTTLEVDVCRSGENTHRIPMTIDAIKNSASSIKGKPILAAYNDTKTDFEGHEIDEFPVGFFSEEEPSLVNKDGELYLRAKGKIWKNYFEDAIDIFHRKDGVTDVSVELNMLRGREATPFEDGEINLFSILGCTLLGVRPSIVGSEARVISFSEMKEEYDREQKSELELFSERRKKKMSEKTYKVNKTELKETAWGNVDKTKLRNTIMDAKNKSSLVKTVYALVENGWENAPSEKLKYPLMELSGDTFYYNRYALSSALAYAKQENETSVINKVMSLYKKFNLDDEDGDDEKMAKDLKNKMEEQPIEMEDKVVDDDKKKEDKMSETEDQSFEDDKDEPDDKKDVADGEGDDEEAEEFANEDDEEELADGEQKEEDKKEMSLDAYAYSGAMLSMLEAETKEQREEAMQHCMSESKEWNIVMEKISAMCDKMSELKAFKAQKEEEETRFAVDKALASVKNVLSAEDYAKFEEKGKQCTFADKEKFAFEVKAFAYDNGMFKEQTDDDGIMRMSGDNVSKKEEVTYKNIFDKILNK